MSATFAEVFSEPTLLTWIVFLFSTWAILTVLFKRVPVFDKKPGGSAHQVVVIVPFMYLAITGTSMWFFDPDFAAAFAHDKVYDYYAPARRLVLVMLAFQIWDLYTTLMTPELRKLEHCIHHFIAGTLAYIGLTNGSQGFLLYYGAFFFGVSELSSIPLAAVDLFRLNKDLVSGLSAVNELSRISFAFLFLMFRCMYWPFVSVSFWRATLISDAPAALLSCWYVSNIGLTGLQYYWGMLIVKGIIKLLRGDESQIEDPSFSDFDDASPLVE